MERLSLTDPANIRKLSLGLVIFLALVLVIPLATVSLASFGPSEWIYNIAPYLEYKFLLVFVAGICIGAIAKHSPALNAVIVGTLGSITLALIKYIIALEHHDIFITDILWQGFQTLALCALGGVCVSLFRFVHSKL